VKPIPGHKGNIDKECKAKDETEEYFNKVIFLLHRALASKNPLQSLKPVDITWKYMHNSQLG